MLVISRSDGEAVWIGNARVFVEQDGRGKSRIYIDAPEHVSVVREELLDARDLQAIESGADAATIRHRGRRPGRSGVADRVTHGSRVGRDAG